MSDQSDNQAPESGETPKPSNDTQENHNAETEEDTASGGAAAEPSPKDL